MPEDETVDQVAEVVQASATPMVNQQLVGVDFANLR